jgi:hypothetical protein
MAVLTAAAFTEHTSITLEDDPVQVTNTHARSPCLTDQFGPALTNKSSLHKNNIPSLKTPTRLATHRIHNKQGPGQ